VILKAPFFSALVISALNFCRTIVQQKKFEELTMRKNVPVDDNVLTESEEVFEKAAEVFRGM